MTRSSLNSVILALDYRSVLGSRLETPGLGSEFLLNPTLIPSGTQFEDSNPTLAVPPGVAQLVYRLAEGEGRLGRLRLKLDETSLIRDSRCNSGYKF